MMDEDGHLLLVLHEAPRPEDDELRKPALFWCQPSGEWKSFPESGGLTALDAHLASYLRSVHALDEAVEAASSPRQYFGVMKHVTPLQRATRNLSAVMQEARAARPDERRLINLRDTAGDLERGIDLVAGDAKAGMEFALAENTEEQARFAHEATLEARKLNRLAALFFPLATLAGIFGMNPPSDVMSLPGFWIVLAIGVSVGLILRRPPAGER